MCKYLTSSDIPKAATFGTPISYAWKWNGRHSWSWTAEMMHFRYIWSTMQLCHLIMTPKGTSGYCSTMIFHFPPSSFNHNATTMGATAYFPWAAGCTSSSRGAEIPWQDSKSYMQQTHLGPGIMFGRREYWGSVKDAAHAAGPLGPCFSCNVDVMYLPPAP